MSISLSDGTTTVALNPDLFWADEFDWNPVEQTAERTITGALVVMASARVAGRPITLEPENDGQVWMRREVVEQLRNWAAVPGQSLTLILRGISRTVLFRHQDNGLEAKPVVQFRDSDTLPSDFYLCTVRLMEI